MILNSLRYEALILFIYFQGIIWSRKDLMRVFEVILRHKATNPDFKSFTMIHFIKLNKDIKLYFFSRH